MTSTTVTDVSSVNPARPHERVLPEHRGVFHDTWVVAKRGLIHMKRQPEALSDATVQPIMFVLLFGFVFCGAIGVPCGSYRDPYASLPASRYESWELAATSSDRRAARVGGDGSSAAGAAPTRFANDR